MSDEHGRQSIVSFGPDVSPPAVKIGAYIPVTDELMRDGLDVQSYLAQAMRRVTHPWEFPDRTPFPRIDPVPRLTHWLHRWADLRTRIGDALDVLRHGLPESDDW